MSEHSTSRSDADLIAALRAGLEESDPVPEDVTAFAKAVFTWGDIEAELASLDFDSAASTEVSGVRSSATARMISFQAGQWMLDIEYDEITGRLLGVISPEASFRVDLHTSGAFFTTESDASGRFEAEGVSRGPLSLVLRFTDGQIVKTQWVVL
ncbi:MAG TPA: hypothetical protein VFT85_04615 [Acidimicrobiia bacterium]|nr:hypothetical protein [Acidimicrobiia bacterium]